MGRRRRSLIKKKTGALGTGLVPSPPVSAPPSPEVPPSSDAEGTPATASNEAEALVPPASEQAAMDGETVIRGVPQSILEDHLDTLPGAAPSNEPPPPLPEFATTEEIPELGPREAWVDTASPSAHAVPSVDESEAPLPHRIGHDKPPPFEVVARRPLSPRPPRGVPDRPAVTPLSVPGDASMEAPSVLLDPPPVRHATPAPTPIRQRTGEDWIEDSETEVIDAPTEPLPFARDGGGGAEFADGELRRDLFMVGDLDDEPPPIPDLSRLQVASAAAVAQRISLPPGFEADEAPLPMGFKSAPALGPAELLLEEPVFAEDDGSGFHEAPDRADPPTEEVPVAFLGQLSELHRTTNRVPEPIPLPGLLDRSTPIRPQRRATPMPAADRRTPGPGRPRRAKASGPAAAPARRQPVAMDLTREQLALGVVVFLIGSAGSLLFIWLYFRDAT